MKKISKVKGFFATFEENKTDLLFDKVGLTLINKTPGLYILNEQKNRLIHKKTPGLQISIASMCMHKVGDVILWSPGVQVQISEVNLIQLCDITEELALRTGVESIGDSRWIHYCPEKFYPKSILNKQEPGHPYFTTAVGSFHSLWCKKYDILEIYANPWIWQYTCKPLNT